MIFVINGNSGVIMGQLTEVKFENEDIAFQIPITEERKFVENVIYHMNIGNVRHVVLEDGKFILPKGMLKNVYFWGKEYE
jgi:hypothetical protein